MNRFWINAGAAAFLGALGCAPAGADVFEYEWNRPDFTIGWTDVAGAPVSARTTYDTSSEVLTWEINFRDTLAEGLTLVLSDGEFPTDSGRFAILFLDASDASDIKANVYAYAGGNSPASSARDGTAFVPGDQAPDKILSTEAGPSGWFLGAAVTDIAGDRTIAFSLDASAINVHTPLYDGRYGPVAWVGMRFADRIGIWQHMFSGLSTAYGTDGFLTRWDFDAEGVFDGIADTTPSDDCMPDVVCEVIPLLPPCPCDWDGDGELTAADTDAFIADFLADDADFDLDGDTDDDDLTDFLACLGVTDGPCAAVIVGDDCCRDDSGNEQDIESLDMRYTGLGCDATSTQQDSSKVECDGDPNFADEVYIVAQDKDDPDDDKARIWFAGNVGLGQAFRIDARNADRDKLKSSTHVFVYDASGQNLLQTIEFHTSCSQPLSTGDQYGSLLLLGCQGDGNDDDGPNPNEPQCSVVEINIEDLNLCPDAVIDAVIETDCETIPVVDGDIIEVCCLPASTQDDDVCADKDNKPVALTLTYTGEDCSASSNSQDSGKTDCDGNPAFASPVFIRVTEKEDPGEDDGKIYFEGTVDLGDAFEATTANANTDKFKSKTFVHIFDSLTGDVLQSIEFHTSCSQPLNVGDTFGSIVLTGFELEDGTAGGPALECGSEFVDGRLQIRGSNVTLRVMAFASDGTLIECEKTLCVPEPDIGDGEDCCADGNKPSALTLRYTGEDCSATQNAQDDNKVECDGDPAFAADVFIRVQDSDDPSDNGARVYFEGNVPLGGLLVADTQYAGTDKFKSATFVFIYDSAGQNLLQSIEFHTSCSQPLFVGDVFGAVEIIACRGPVTSGTTDDAPRVRLKSRGKAGVGP